jgi:hypothetical protein
MDSLLQMTDIAIFIVLSCFSIVISIVAIFIIKRYVPTRVRYRDNPAIANMSALIGIIYGVLSGLTALYLLNNVNYTSDAVQREANGVANTYRDSQWLPEPLKTKVKASIKSYLTEVINVEWPLMKKGRQLDNAGDVIIESMASDVIHYSPPSNVATMIQRDILGEIKSLYDARHQRINMSYSSLSSEIWDVILIGTILTIAINYLLKMNFYLHILTVSAAALMTSSMIFLLITLDKPFQGEFVIAPDALQAVLKLMEQPVKTLDNSR